MCNCTSSECCEHIIDVTSPEGIMKSLEDLGFEAQDFNGIVVTSIQGKFPVAIEPREGEVKITCELCKFGQIEDEKKALVSMAALDANTLDAITPFAFGIVSTLDDPEMPEEDAMLVLVDSIESDFVTEDFLSKKMDELMEAIVASRDVLEIAFA